MAPTFAEKPTIRQDADGTTLIFHCSIMADPKPTISWFRNGVKVQDNEKFQVRIMTFSRPNAIANFSMNCTQQVVLKDENAYTIDCSLFLRSVTVEDAGKYKVTARNDLGESNATISLNFDSELASRLTFFYKVRGNMPTYVFLLIGEEAPIPQGGVRPTFTERPVIRQVEEGKIAFECRMVGEPRPDISWFHNEEKIKEGRRHKMTVTEDVNKLFYVVRLEISGVEAADAGTYKAVAKNSLGEGHATINLTFEEGKCS